MDAGSFRPGIRACGGRPVRRGAEPAGGANSSPITSRTPMPHRPPSLPHLGGVTAVILFAIVLAAFVVESELAQVSGFYPYTGKMASSDLPAVCANDAGVQAALLHLVSLQLYWEVPRNSPSRQLYRPFVIRHQLPLTCTLPPNDNKVHPERPAQRSQAGDHRPSNT